MHFAEISMYIVYMCSSTSSLDEESSLTRFVIQKISGRVVDNIYAKENEIFNFIFHPSMVLHLRKCTYVLGVYASRWINSFLFKTWSYVCLAQLVFCPPIVGVCWWPECPLSSSLSWKRVFLKYRWSSHKEIGQYQVIMQRFLWIQKFSFHLLNGNFPS